jgi:hypothetical protein
MPLLIPIASELARVLRLKIPDSQASGLSLSTCPAVKLFRAKNQRMQMNRNQIITES